MIYDIAVVGAGVCGIFAAINSHSESIIIFDKKTGAEKLAITGNNKCNITNSLEKEEFIEHYGKNGNFLRNAFNLFFRDDLLKYLKIMGFETLFMGNRIVLKDKDSREFAHELLKKAKLKSAAFKKNEQVVDIEKRNGIFELATNKGIYKAEFVLMSCGGKSYPQTGSDGGCYDIAERLGHTIMKPEAHEVPFCSKNTKSLQGLSFLDVDLVLKVGKKQTKTSGDIIFTHFGISGPAILTLSSRSFNKAVLYINFLKTDENDFIGKLLSYKGKTKNFLKWYLPNRFIEEVLNIEKYTQELSKRDINFIMDTLCRFKMNVKKCSFDKAFVTKGGVNTKEINPKTMESKIVSNLFFCGEIVDIQGSIGGFNLQAAFSTGFCAMHTINSRIKALSVLVKI